ncbi:MAG: hypothetical protein H0T89_18225 [Deltaproteobacteria bacterium]|nr:hypothetical protein [Deltaproteobacteria bacterium]
MIEDAAVAAANSALARLNIQPFPNAPTQVTKPGTTVLGKDVSLVWTSKQTHKGGENMPPTHKHTAVVKCVGKSIDLAASEIEGVNPTFTTWSVGDHVVIETIVTTAREGEYGEERSVAVVELATCKSTKAPT